MCIDRAWQHDAMHFLLLTQLNVLYALTLGTKCMQCQNLFFTYQKQLSVIGKSYPVTYQYNNKII